MDRNSDIQEYCACTTFEQMIEADERGIARLQQAFGKMASASSRFDNGDKDSEKHTQDAPAE